jgi:hypothetical protein
MTNGWAKDRGSAEGDNGVPTNVVGQQARCYTEHLYSSGNVCSASSRGKDIPLAVMCVSAYMWAYLSIIDIFRNRLINEW